MERRKSVRRASTAAPPFPLLTVHGRIMEDRRERPDRRAVHGVGDIKFATLCFILALVGVMFFTGFMLVEILSWFVLGK